MNEIDINNSVILITGVAGFIGGALALRLISTTSAQVIGIDNMNDYYDVRLKEYRLNRISERDDEKRFTFIKADIADKEKVFEVFTTYKPDVVVHLAAQAGVRYSIDNPDVYIQSNIVGFFNVIEACRYSRDISESKVKHLIYASSSSVYGDNEKVPYSIEDKTDFPVSLYAATKKADEILAYSYSKLYGIRMTGLRFFTVYGPAGRPDMAYFKFTEQLRLGKKIELYNMGNNKRDFTYIEDVIDALELIVENGCIESGGIHSIYNVGHGTPLDLFKFVSTIVGKMKKYDLINNNMDVNNYISLVGRQLGDVDITYADTEPLRKTLGYQPMTSLEDGIDAYVSWFKEYKGI